LQFYNIVISIVSSSKSSVAFMLHKLEMSSTLMSQITSTIFIAPNNITFTFTGYSKLKNRISVVSTLKIVIIIIIIKCKKPSVL